ncbi:hypothetical protein GLOIN_2v1849086 [Rhizophagus clarus]|uniref:Uncharacterized protein n=1 Tax=Rhizophagus clarus TaxID=94130 RepID=A0A8H3QXG9_9GLOM|nr:hypothetical protein GLOIN_2v1849086 [Rhizophagus clarus]
MTYVTRLSVKKNKQGKNEINNNNNNNKSNGKGRSNQKQKKKISPLPQQNPQYVKVYINGILAIKIEDGEEYALLAYSDPDLVPDWQPIRNLRNANALVKKFRNSLNKSQAEKSNPNQMVIDEENFPLEWKDSCLGLFRIFRFSLSFFFL